MCGFNILSVVIFIISLLDLCIVMGADYIHGISINVLTNDSHILIFDLRQPPITIKDIQIRNPNQLSLVNISIHSNLIIQLKLKIQNAVDHYEEVPHSQDDNQFVLESDRESDIFPLRQPMLTIIDNYCARPLPKQYYIIKDTYKGRITLAYPELCTTEKMCRYTDQTYYRRSINEMCAWQKRNGLVNQDEELEQLQDNLNSVFCVANSPLLTHLFQENIKEDDNFLLKPDCEIAKARCTDCQILRCRSKQSCCTNTANCLLNEHCIKFYSLECDGSQDHNGTNNGPQCMKGSTYKFTLTPHFDFDKRHFLCHLRRQHKVVNISGQVTLDTISKSFRPIIMTNFSRAFTNSNILTVSNLQISLIPSLMNTMEDVIFERRGYEYFMHSVKTESQFDLSPPKVYDHFSKSYIKVQFHTPFQFTTATWSKETCGVNTSHIYSAQSIHDNRSTVPIRLLSRPIKNVDKDGLQFFHYKILPVALSPVVISLKCLDNSSLLSLLFCNLNDSKLPTNVELDVELSGPNTWTLHIRGDLPGQFTLLTISIWDAKHPKDTIFHSDIYVTKRSSLQSPERSIALALSISINSTRLSIVQLDIVLYHCKSILHKMSIFLKANDNSMASSYPKELENPKDISNFLLTFFLSILSISFLYFILLSFQAVRRSSKVQLKKVTTQKKVVNKKLNNKFFLKAILYLTLKLFYTVSFTLSLVLSVCLSLNAVIASLNQSDNYQLVHGAKNITAWTNHVNVACAEFSKNISNDFLTKTGLVMSNNDQIRTQSAQNTQNVLFSLIKLNPINKTQVFLQKVINSTYYVIDQRLQRILGNYIKIHDQIKDSKWLLILRDWNSSVTSVSFDSSFKEGYLRNFNLLRLYSATSAMENCVILRRRFTHWKPQSMEQRVQSIVNRTQYPKSPVLAVPRGIHYRYFISHDRRQKIREWQPLNGNKSKGIMSLEMIKIRLIFMLIDTVLIIYRFYWTFSDIQQIWKSKKDVVQFDQINMKGNHHTYMDRAKPSALQWTKQHHLECLISAHLIIAAIIIIISIVCTNLIVLLTSKEHAHWLSRKTGNIVRVRSLRIMKDRLSQFNAINIAPIQRHWEYVRTVKMKELMFYRQISSKKMMQLELFFNQFYFHELCHFQNILSPSLQSINFCSSIMPNEQIMPGNICGGSSKCPFLLSYNLSAYSSSKTLYYVNTYIHFSVHVLAIVILVAAIIGIVKIFRKQIGNSMLSSGQSTYIIYVTQQKYFNHQQYFKSTATVEVTKEMSNIYGNSLNPHKLYQCWKNNPCERKNTAF